ncbi:MAG: hypothetical protein OEW98_00240 [Betaproteobacteria bacterium]|nr:hypothetical protein [Betaproteobacteria bacterium]
MAVNALLVDWQLNGDGTIKVIWEDGHSNLFRDLAEVREQITGLDSDRTMAERLLLAWFLSRSADASNTNLVEGKRLTFDLSAPNPIRVQ